MGEVKLAVSKDDLGSRFAGERLKLRLSRLARRWAGRPMRTVRGTGVENLHLMEPMLRLGEPVANELELSQRSWLKSPGGTAAAVFGLAMVPSLGETVAAAAAPLG